MKIRVSDSAFSDLENIKEYYAELEIPVVGIKIICEIFAHIDTLYEHPKIDRSVPEFDDESIRETIHPPFRMVYLLGDDVIHIIRVWRSERLLKLPESDI